jgi:Fis family transcriptional regulator
LTTQELLELGSHPVTSESTEASETLASSVISYLKDAINKNEGNIYDKIHQEVDRALFSSMLTHVRENQSEAARLLGISRLTLRKKLKY